MGSIRVPAGWVDRYSDGHLDTAVSVSACPAPGVQEGIHERFFLAHVFSMDGVRTRVSSAVRFSRTKHYGFQC